MRKQAALRLARDTGEVSPGTPQAGRKPLSAGPDLVGKVREV